jgi:hypothetical protein
MRAMDVAQHLSNLILKLWQSSSLKRKNNLIWKKMFCNFFEKSFNTDCPLPLLS